MQRVSNPWVAATGVLLLALVAAPSEARPDFRDNGAARQDQRATIDQNRAAAIVQEATGGRVLAVEMTSKGGRVVHHVKVLLPGGRVRIVTVDGETGKLR